MINEYDMTNELLRAMWIVIVCVCGLCIHLLKLNNLTIAFKTKQVKQMI